MVNLSFNPFDADLAQLETKHLSVLRDVAEGWYVEYKREVVASKRIAKSLAAFANHYGGWLFYGIEQSKDGRNQAGSFLGIDKMSVTQCIENIRNAAKDSIHPSPYFDYKVLEGPCTEINLPEDKSIIVIAIPTGPDAPYVHSDGRIYRRVADASDPRPETDRFILDHLWQRRQQAHDKLKTLLSQRPMLSKAESERSLIQLFLFIDPLGATGQHIDLTFAEFREVMSGVQSPEEGLGIAFDNFFTMSDGLVCRQVGFYDPFDLLFTWRYYSDASAIVSLPVSSAWIPELSQSGLRDKTFLGRYEYGQQALELLQRHRHTTPHILDINGMYYAIAAILCQYHRLVAASRVRGQIYAKALLQNLWRKIPFLDTAAYIRYVEENGFPLIQSDEEFAPPGNTFDSLQIMTPLDRRSPGGVDEFLEALPLLQRIANAVGLPVGVALDPDFAWVSAAGRAVRISQTRSSHLGT